MEVFVQTVLKPHSVEFMDVKPVARDRMKRQTVVSEGQARTES